MNDPSNVTSLHPPISKVEVQRGAFEGQDLINGAGVIKIAKLGETPEARRFYRLYLAEFRKRKDWGLTHEDREQQAVLAVLNRLGIPVQTMTGGPSHD